MLKSITREPPPTMEERIKQAKESIPKDPALRESWLKGFLVGSDLSRQWKEEALAWRLDALNGMLNYFLLVKLSKLGEDVIEQLNQQWEEFVAGLGPIEQVTNETVVNAAKEFVMNYKPTVLTESVM